MQPSATADRTDKLARLLAGRRHAVEQIEEVICGQLVLGTLQHLFGTATLGWPELLLLAAFPPIVWGADEIRRWANGVLKQLAECADLKQDQFTFLAGEKYRKFLIPQISHVHVPMEGLPIGKQLQYLSRGRNE